MIEWLCTHMPQVPASLYMSYAAVLSIAVAASIVSTVGTRVEALKAELLKRVGTDPKTGSKLVHPNKRAQELATWDHEGDTARLVKVTLFAVTVSLAYGAAAIIPYLSDSCTYRITVVGASWAGLVLFGVAFAISFVILSRTAELARIVSEMR